MMRQWQRVFSITRASCFYNTPSHGSVVSEAVRSFGTMSKKTKSFAELGLNPRLVTALTEMGVNEPTTIQQKSIPAILSRTNVLCMAQTGTGKTLAYMAPIVEQLYRAETTAIAEPTEKHFSRPQVLVLCPSRELALQVGQVAKQLAHTAKFASCTITTGDPKRLQQRLLSKRLDMVIGTPGRISTCISKGDFYLSRIHTIVLDEADTLIDAKMGYKTELDQVLKPIYDSIKKRQATLQVILVAATVRSPLGEVINKRFGELKHISDDLIHSTPLLLQEEFIKAKVEEKHSLLRQILHQRPLQTIVFCKNVASCRSTDHMLREHGFQSLCLHGDMPKELRTISIQQFQHKKNPIKVLVCTDLAARGLDLDHVQHVIMFDFPTTIVDYIHRAGRTGRAGQKGLVTSLVTKYDTVLAQSIQQSKRTYKMKPETSVEKEENPEKRPYHPKKRKDMGYGTKRLKPHQLRTF